MPVVTNGLQLYYNSQSPDNTSTTAKDLSPNNRNGSITGAVNNGAQGWKFDGVDDVITTAYNPNISRAAFTYEVWFRRPDITATARNLLSTAAGTQYINAINATFQMQVANVAGPNPTGSRYAANNIVHLIVAAADRNNTIVYCNGVNIGSLTSNHDGTFSGNVQIGRRGGATASPFNGDIFAVRLYNRQLSAAEVTQNFNNGIALGLAIAYTGSESDAVTLIDSIETLFTPGAPEAFTISLADDIATVDSAETIFTPAPVINNAAVSLNDSVNVTDTLRKSVSTRESDSIATSDTISKRITAAVFEMISFTETAGKTNTKPLADGFLVTDAIASTKGKALALNDSVTLFDSIAKALSRGYSDSITAAESDTASIAKRLLDALAATDSVTKLTGKAVSLTDSILITETLSKRLSKLRTDVVTASESSRESSSRMLLDSLTQTDAIVIGGGKVVILSDNLTLMDLFSKHLKVMNAESISISDSIGRQAKMSLRLFDVTVTKDDYNVSLPTAPTLIGTIELEAEQSLYVYLSGERDLTQQLDAAWATMVPLQGTRELQVPLHGTRELMVPLRGEIEMAVKDVHLEIYVGESKIYPVTVTDRGAVLKLTGNASAKWVMKKSVLDPHVDVLKDTSNGGIVITDADNGIFEIRLNATDTRNLQPGHYYHEAKVIDSAGHESPVLIGTINLLPSAT